MKPISQQELLNGTRDPDDPVACLFLVVSADPFVPLQEKDRIFAVEHVGLFTCAEAAIKAKLAVVDWAMHGKAHRPEGTAFKSITAMAYAMWAESEVDLQQYVARLNQYKRLQQRSQMNQAATYLQTGHCIAQETIVFKYPELEAAHAEAEAVVKGKAPGQWGTGTGWSDITDM